jgi:microcystin-dependent protein
MTIPYIGEIRIFAGDFSPDKWHLCDGSVLPISAHEVLFNVIGNQYGGDGMETFGLPDLRGRAPIHRGPSNPMASPGGAESVVLTTNEVPSHNHSFVATRGLANQPTPGGNRPAQSGTVQLYAEGPIGAQMSPRGMEPPGNRAHDNMHPYLALNFIIALDGLIPHLDTSEEAAS